MTNEQRISLQAHGSNETDDQIDRIAIHNFVSYMTKNTHFRKIAQIIQLAILEITL